MHISLDTASAGPYDGPGEFLAARRRPSPMLPHDPTAPEALTPREIGVDDLPFTFIPGAFLSPLVVSFPHIGLHWPADFSRPPPQVNFGRNADYEVHSLFPGASASGAALLQAHYSRLLVDLNRAPDDVRPSLVEGHPAPRPRPPTRGLGPQIPNRGVLWDTAVGNIPILSGPISRAEFSQRIHRYHAPYHRALELLLDRRRACFGRAILLDAHSMPSSVDGDIILGTLEGGACAPELQERALEVLRARDPEFGVALDVRLNDPYRGGEIVRAFGRPERGSHALQVEVNRALYMDEANLRLWPAPVEGARMLTPKLRRLGALHRRLAAMLQTLRDLAPDPLARGRDEPQRLRTASEAAQEGDSLVFSAASGLKSP